MRQKLGRLWAKLWMRFAWTGWFGPIARRAAGIGIPRYKARRRLARLHPRGYLAPSCVVDGVKLNLGKHVFIGERVVLYRAGGDGEVSIGDGTCIHQDTIIEVGEGGSVEIGAGTHIQARLQLSAYKAPIKIGDRVQIAQNCAFYSYNHGIAPGEAMIRQPLQTKGSIAIEDDAWLGAGVVVLDGVTIGRGAVIGAGSVVSRSVAANTVAAGVPARVIGRRGAGTGEDSSTAPAQGSDDV